MDSDIIIPVLRRNFANTRESEERSRLGHHDALENALANIIIMAIQSCSISNPSGRRDMQSLRGQGLAQVSPSASDQSCGVLVDSLGMEDDTLGRIAGRFDYVIAHPGRSSACLLLSYTT